MLSQFFEKPVKIRDKKLEGLRKELEQAQISGNEEEVERLEGEIQKLILQGEDHEDDD